MFPDARAAKLQRLQRFISHGELTPTSVELHIASRCNLRCQFCALTGKPRFEEAPLGLEDWQRIVAELLALGVREWRLGGGLGEVMCDPELFLPLAAQIKRGGGRGTLITNGALFADEHIRLLADLGWDRIDFSLDGGAAATHDRLRGVPGSFIRTITVIEKFHRLASAGSSPLVLNLICVLMKANQHEAGELIELAAKLGIAHVHFEPIAGVNSFAQQQKIVSETDPEAVDSLQAAAELAARLGVATNAGSFFRQQPPSDRPSPLNQQPHLNQQPPSTRPDRAPAASFKPSPIFRAAILASAALPSRFPSFWRRLPLDARRAIVSDASCFEPFLGLVVHRDGQITPCCSIRRLALYHREQSLSRIWLGSRFQRLRRRLLLQDPAELCRSCTASMRDKTAGFRQDLIASLKP